jgi:hypothetical protein
VAPELPREPTERRNTMAKKTKKLAKNKKLEKKQTLRGGHFPN